MCVQVALIISGNLSFLNWLTLIPAILCCDDKSLCWLFPSSTRHRVVDLQQHWRHSNTRLLSIIIIMLGYFNTLISEHADTHVHVDEKALMSVHFSSHYQCRLLHPPGIVSCAGGTDCLPQYPSSPEPSLLAATHEYFVRLSQNCQHLWSLRQVN